MGLVEKNDITNPKSSSPHKMDEDGKPLPRRIKIITAVAIFYGNVAFGCALSSLNPAITSLQTKYDVDDAAISKVFTIMTGCYMVGALSGGIIFNYINRQLVAIVILSTMATVMFLTPHCPTLTLFFIAAAVLGLTCGSYDTAQFVWMMEMMQKDCPPYVQSQHFFFALGPNLANLIMAPFLDKNDNDFTTTTSSARNTWHVDFHANETGKSDNDTSSDHDKLFIPFTIIGFLVSTVVVIQTVLFIFFRYHAPPPEIMENAKETTSIVDSKKAEAEAKPLIGQWSWPKLRMVILSCCFFGAYQGMEMCTFQFFSKFAQNSDLHLSESKAAYVLTGMTATYAAGRAVAIVAVFKISTQKILCGNLTLVAIANVLLVGWAIRSLPVLWASSIIFGLGFSSTLASYSAFTERYLYFTNFIGSLMLVCGSGVASIYPLVVGSFIEENPIVLSYTLFFSIALLFVSFGSVSYLTHRNKTRY